MKNPRHIPFYDFNHKDSDSMRPFPLLRILHKVRKNYTLVIYFSTLVIEMKFCNVSKYPVSIIVLYAIRH